MNNTMKPICEVYPNEAKTEHDCGSFYGPCDYGPMLDSMGYETLLQVDDNDYQGDSRLLLRSGTRYGILIFGWGSCSGCDSLQACETMKAVDELRTSLLGDIKWFDSREECARYFDTHDWEGDYSWHAEETKRFINEGRKLLSASATPPAS